MRIIRAGEGRRVPWKNGSGWTTEIAVHPEGAALDDFVWRLSTAQVTEDGPFSLFPNVDRSLAILGGAGLRLTLAGVDHRLDAAEPLRFPGDAPATAVLLDGPVTDLNVMTRRGRARHHMRRHAIAEELRVPCDTDTTLVYCAEGTLTLAAAALAQGDAAILDATSLRLGGNGIALVIEITVL